MCSVSHFFYRTDKKDESSNRSRDLNAGIYDGFSETQTESQVSAPHHLVIITLFLPQSQIKSLYLTFTLFKDTLVSTLSMVKIITSFFSKKKRSCLSPFYFSPG